MRKIEWEELKRMPQAGSFVNWIQPWVEEALFSCFQFLALELEPAEKFNSDGGVCLLAAGSGRADGKRIGTGEAFGMVREKEKAVCVPQWFRAEETTVLLCFNTNIFDNVCFGMGCGGMHTRIREMILSG